MALFFVACGGTAPAPRPVQPVQAKPSAPAKSPLVAIDERAITLDGQQVADARAIEAGAKITRLDVLFDRLKAKRAAWTEAHIGERAPRDVWYEVDGSAGHRAALSAILSATFSGHDHAHFRDGDAWVDGFWETPRPPGQDAVKNRVVVHLDGDDVRATWQSERPCDGVPQEGATKLAEAPRYFETTCTWGSPCVDVARVHYTLRTRFADVVRALSAIRARSGGDMRFSLVLVADAAPQAQRKCGEALSAGHIPPGHIRDRIRESYPKIRACYDAGLKRDPKLTGRVVVKFVIDASGKVADAKVEDVGTVKSTMPDKAVSDCVRDAIKQITFPQPQGGNVTVAYPIMFSPDAPDPE